MLNVVKSAAGGKEFFCIILKTLLICLIYFFKSDFLPEEKEEFEKMGLKTDY